MNRLSKYLSRTSRVFAALAIIFAQAVPIALLKGAPAIAATPTVTDCPAPSLTNSSYIDQQGANDEPGQKDLTRMCTLESVASHLLISGSWDEIGWSGSNTGDACVLFDSDGDGMANHAICAIIGGSPATLNQAVAYTCNDTSAYNCNGASNTVVLTNLPKSGCAVDQRATDPFANGASSPQDTTATCYIDYTELGMSAVDFLDMCSYPSSSPNSDPSDCIFYKKDSAKIEVQKVVIPAADTGKFNLAINGTNYATDIGNGGTTGQQVLNSGSIKVSETAGTGLANLSAYNTSIVCKDGNGTGAVVGQVSNLSGNAARELTFTASNGSDIICVVTNTKNSSITIIKDAQPNRAQDFSFTTTGGLTPAAFLLDDDADATLPNQQLFNSLAAGTYTVTETATAGWDLRSLVCSGGTTQVNGATVTITLAAGDAVVCTFTNAKRGTITVNKVTEPANDPTVFPINITGTGNIAGTAGRDLTTSTAVVYDVGEGAYSVTETVPQGWTQKSNNCTTANLTIAPVNSSTEASLTKTCTIVNTKLASLTITKDAQLNSLQDFNFTTSALTPSSFTLDDDLGVEGADTTNSNQQTFSNLIPGTTYSVAEASDVAGWKLTNITCTNATADLASRSITYTPIAGQTAECTFINTKLLSITGTKWQSNADGTGSVLAGWVINLLNANGGTITSTTTDANGAYSFDGLLPDSYQVTEATVSGWTQLTNNSTCKFTAYTIGLQVGENANNLDFCNFKNGSISGYKFNDHNGNAAEDSDDEHLAGWEITLSSVTANGTTQVDSAITDANGDYSFSNVAPGTYQVCETNKTNWVQTYPTTNNGCHEIVIDVSNEQNTAVKFGNQGQGTVRVLKNIDMNNDGDTTDAEDIVGATNWQWTLDATAPQNTGAAAITTSAGSHTISEVQQAGYYVTGVSCSGEDGLPVSTSASIQLSVGENVVCTFTNARTLTSLTVNKVVINDNGGNGQASDFSFTMNGVVGAQTFVNNAGSTTSGSVALSLDPGTYTATEVTPHVGYTETSNTCQNIVLTLNQPASCTITNDDIAPTLTVIKNVTNSAGGNNSASSFDIRVNNVSLTGAVSSNNNQAATYTVADVAANTPYTVSEVASFGYNQVGSISCTDNETQATIANPVTLNEAQNVTCVINNIDVAPKLTLQKSLPSPQYGDTATPHDWTLTATPAAGTTLSGRGGSDATDLTNFITRTASSNLVYTLSESGPSGYTPGDAWSCQNNITGSTFSFTTPNQISLDEGADVTCTIINTAIQPKLVVIKHVVNDNGGTKTASDFTMNVTAVSPSQTSFAGSEAGVEVLVNVGDYSIDETEIAGYKKTLGEDCTGSISVGETKTCTITNDDIPPVLVVTKVTYPDEDAQDFNFTVNNPGGEDGLYASPVLDTDESSETPSSYSTQAEDSDEIDMNSRFQAGSTSVSEALPEGWVQNAADCFVYDDGLKSVGVAFEAELGKYYECAFYNERAPKLDISKTNDQPNPIKPGTVVNYTVTLTVPESSGKVYGDCKRFGDEETTDLEEFQCQSDEPVIISDTMPVGVTYNPGSFRIVTNQDENDFTSDVTEPVFSNGVGVWEIPFVYLFPGEVITLTYSATVDSTVQPGCFTNQVFGKGYDFKGTSEVLTPFADSKVCVPAELAPPTGQVLSATKTVLVNTGRSPLVYVAVGVGLVILAVGLSRRDSRKDLAIILFAGVVGWTFLHGGKGFAATAINLDQPTSPGKISSLQLGYQVSETDALQDFTINLYQNGSLVSSQNLSEAYGGSGSFVVNLPNDGSYNFYAVAVSTSGNTKQSNSVSYVLDKTAPASSSSVGLTRTGNTYAVTYTVPEGSGAANVFIYASSANPVVINEANKVASLAANPGSAQTFSYTAPDATPRNFAVVVVDSLGNASTPVANEVVTTQTVTNTSSQPSSTTSSSSSSVTSSSPQILPAETVNEPETDDQTAAVTKIADAKQASNNGVWWVVGGLLAAGTLAYVYRRYQDAVVGSDDKKSSK